MLNLIFIYIYFFEFMIMKIIKNLVLVAALVGTVSSCMGLSALTSTYVKALKKETVVPRMGWSALTSTYVNVKTRGGALPKYQPAQANNEIANLIKEGQERTQWWEGCIKREKNELQGKKSKKKNRKTCFLDAHAKQNAFIALMDDLRKDEATAAESYNSSGTLARGMEKKLDMVHSQFDFVLKQEVDLSEAALKGNSKSPKLVQKLCERYTISCGAILILTRAISEQVTSVRELSRANKVTRQLMTEALLQDKKNLRIHEKIVKALSPIITIKCSGEQQLFTINGIPGGLL